MRLRPRQRLASRARLLTSAALCCFGALSLAQVARADSDDYGLPVFQSDFGGVGLLQTPTARMAPVGRLSFTLDRTDPYTHYTFSAQPFEWMEAGFRYTSISNRIYGRGEPDRDYLDKGVDVKFALKDESRFIPAVSVGFRDIGGTGLFSSEYVVANKRWYDFDFSLGLAWGYGGSRGDISNPLNVFGSRFRERIDEDTGQGGDFNIRQMFTGRPSIFGGIQYQTPFKPLTLQLEYEGNDYKSEPKDNAQDQDSPFNIGMRYQVGEYLTLSAAWERGNTAMIGATLSMNLGSLSQIKNDPVPVAPKPVRQSSGSVDWDAVAESLQTNAGLAVTRIDREGDALRVEGAPIRYRAMPRAEMRANRILHNAAPADVTEFRYRLFTGGMLMREDILPRAPLPDEPLIVPPNDPNSDLDYRHAVVSQSASGSADDGQLLYESFGDRFSWSLSPELNQNFGGPDGYLYKVLAQANAEFRTDAHGWFSGVVGYSVFDNVDNYSYSGPSELPRVRSYIGRYLSQTGLGVYNLQYTRTARLGENWFGMAYGGLLEQMFAGGGGEILYRPFNSNFALSAQANYVRQRDFDTRFELQDYTTWTGHLTAYVHTGIKDVLAKFSVGRYLAKDIGATLDVSRQFESGVRLGAFATITDAGDKFGEGSFDKGIYLSMPLDLFFTSSSRGNANVTWRPITRDGGAKLARRYSLYGLTETRRLGEYWENYKNSLR